MRVAVTKGRALKNGMHVYSIQLKFPKRKGSKYSNTLPVPGHVEARNAVAAKRKAIVKARAFLRKLR